MTGMSRRWRLLPSYEGAGGGLVGRRTAFRRAAVDLTTNEGDAMRWGWKKETQMEMGRLKGWQDLWPSC